jgi:hypothetical protein
MIEIPEELMHPTVEELEARNAIDMAKKWKPCKKPGKRERLAIKREKDSAKLREIAEEFDNKSKIANQNNSLSVLFANSEKTDFSLAELHGGNEKAAAKHAGTGRPALKVSLEKAPFQSNSRKRGRPPRINPL